MNINEFITKYNNFIYIINVQQILNPYSELICINLYEENIKEKVEEYINNIILKEKDTYVTQKGIVDKNFKLNNVLIQDNTIYAFDYYINNNNNELITSERILKL